MGAAECRGPQGLPGSGARRRADLFGQPHQLRRARPAQDALGHCLADDQGDGRQSYSFRWQFTASHSTTDFKYYVTKQGWNQNHALTRADLNTTPFLTVPYNGQRPPSTLSHAGTLPTGLSGHHVILGVWTIADTANAFYSCADVTF